MVFGTLLAALLCPEAGAVLLLDKPEATLGFFEGGGGLIWLTLLQLSLLAILLFVLLFEQCNTMYTTLCHASSFHGQGHCKLGSVKRCVYLGLDNQFGCREGEGVGNT